MLDNRGMDKPSNLLSPEGDAYSSAVMCQIKHKDFSYDPGLTYCNSTFDSYLCWPPTPAGTNVAQHCPPAKLSDTSRMAVRQCGPNGLWMGRHDNEFSAVGWTNYTPCFPVEVQNLLSKIFEDESNAKMKFEIAQQTRYLEIVGFSASLIALSVSLFIFCTYRSLKNNRTKIHKHLFCALLAQVILRLILYFDQALIRNKMGDHEENYNTTVYGIDNLPYLCETAYMLLEYVVSVMFMWMFIEGFHLHSFVTAAALSANISFRLYYTMGWGIPVVSTMIWASFTARQYNEREDFKTCWYGYNFMPLYWILQAPRLIIILINMGVVVNIIRVLILKLKRSRSTEVAKAKKATRAAMILLPLLGITNLLNMIEAPLDRGALVFAAWSYASHFFRSFQGLFISAIYCFFNSEVQDVLRKDYNDRMAMQQRHPSSLIRFWTYIISKLAIRTREDAFEMQDLHLEPPSVNVWPPETNSTPDTKTTESEPTTENKAETLNDIIEGEIEDKGTAFNGINGNPSCSYKVEHDVQINIDADLEDKLLYRFEEIIKIPYIDDSNSSEDDN